MAANQTFKTHTRFDPLFHFVLIPVLALNLVGACYHVMHHGTGRAGPFVWWAVMSVALLLLALKARMYALRNQDRIIRMEERTRLAILLQPAELLAAQALTIRQLVALRFASDSELPALVKRTLSENLTAREIKQQIVQWRPDNDRI